MSELFSQYAQTVQHLHDAVVELERASRLLKIPTLQGREWFDLLRQKLLPQLRDDVFLVVAVVGGTNIGKSVIFNHLAGCRASSTSPLASGTKHPVCLVPPGFREHHDLAAIFEGFELHEWEDSDAALEDHDEHRLFWRDSEVTAENLLVLDTPDIDSDAQVNWQRADIIRRCADVLIAVLTQQKYNDAAVKQFFRRAAEEDKAVIVVFNQCELPDDEEYWPLWLETFCRETGIHPEFVYIVPNDRRAAEENRLPVYERQPASDVSSKEFPNDNLDLNRPRNLAEDLSRLHFAEVKVRSLRGSLKHLLNSNSGVPAYLNEVKQRSADFQAAASRLSSESLARIDDWPSVPNKIFVDEIRNWWRSQYEGWARRVHGFYDAVGQGVTWPVRMTRDRIFGEPEPPFETYRKQEWSVILKTVEEVYEKLTWMSESGNELLRPRFEQLLAGRSRADLLNRLKRDHDEIDLESELETIVAEEMKSFQTGSPELYRFYRRLNNISAAARPVASVVLFTMGWGPAGEVVAPFVAEAATQALVPIVADFAGGTAAAVAGETVVSSAAGKGAGFLQAKFQQLQTSFTALRAGWLAGLLKEHLLGTLSEELQQAAALPDSETFEQVLKTLDTLQTQMKTAQHQTTV